MWNLGDARCYNKNQLFKIDQTGVQILVLQLTGHESLGKPLGLPSPQFLHL